MIEVKIPKEIRSYQETLFFGLNLRQTLCAVVALAVNVPLYLFLYPRIGSDLAGWIIIFTAVPFILVGFIRMNGMPFERAAVCAARLLFQSQKYSYRTENYFEYLMEDANEAKTKAKERKAGKTKRKNA